MGRCNATTNEDTGEKCNFKKFMPYSSPNSSNCYRTDSNVIDSKTVTPSAPLMIAKDSGDNISDTDNKNIAEALGRKNKHG
jgi:hypothetical protein